jgi:hypothetical protein
MYWTSDSISGERITRETRRNGINTEDTESTDDAENRGINAKRQRALSRKKEAVA